MNHLRLEQMAHDSTLTVANQVINDFSIIMPINQRGLFAGISRYSKQCHGSVIAKNWQDDGWVN
jgi:hypothetical protein